MGKITLSAPAKLNLYLDITGKREDGYHLLESVMQTVSLCDRVSIEIKGEGITVSASDLKVPVNENNICHKAAKLFFDASGIPDGAEISIEKSIPMGAGLGGGSADAAAVFRGLNKLYGNPLSTDELLKLGAETGADVPFCIAGGTKICRGTGGSMSECPELKKQFYLIVKPDFSCNTKAAYEKYDENPIMPKNGLADFFGDFPKNLYNVFDELYKNPEIENIKQKLIENGAVNACLTGSGSAVFGVFESQRTAEEAQDAFPRADGFEAMVAKVTEV